MADYREIGVFQYDMDRDNLESELMQAIWESDDYRLRVEPSAEAGSERKRIEAFQPSRAIDPYLKFLGVRTWPASIYYDVSDSDIEVTVEHRTKKIGKNLEPEARAEDFIDEALTP